MRGREWRIIYLEKVSARKCRGSQLNKCLMYHKSTTHTAIHTPLLTMRRTSYINGGEEGRKDMVIFGYSEVEEDVRRKNETKMINLEAEFE